MEYFKQRIGEINNPLDLTQEERWINDLIMIYGNKVNPRLIEKKQIINDRFNELIGI